MIKEYYVYIIECSNGRLYTGYTVDIKKRFDEHLSGKRGAKFTRSFKPQKLAASWRICGERGEAMRVESFIKSMHRNDKLAISESPEMLIERLNSIDGFLADITVFDCRASV